MDITKIHPYSNEFTSGFIPRRRPKPELPSGIEIRKKLNQRWYDPQSYEAVERPDINLRALQDAGGGGLPSQIYIDLYEASERNGNERLAIACVDAYAKAEKRELASGLVSRSKFTQKNNRPRRNGGKGITSGGKRMIKSAVGWFFATYSRYPLAMITLTMPSLSGEHHQLYCEKFPKIINRMMEAVQRRLRSCGLPDDYAFVIEIQPDRFRRTGVVALHVHALFLGRADKNQPWAISKTWLAKTWGRIIANHIGADVNAAAATRIEVPKTDNLQGEFGKYMSKGDDILPEVHKAGCSLQLPRKWWGISAPLSKKIRSEVEVLRGPVATEFDKALSEGREKKMLSFHRIKRTVVDPETGQEKELDCGAAGRFNSREDRDLIVQLAKQRAKPRSGMCKAKARELRMRELGYSLINRYYPGGYSAFQEWLDLPDESWAVRLNRRAV